MSSDRTENKAPRTLHVRATRTKVSSQLRDAEDLRSLAHASGYHLLVVTSRWCSGYQHYLVNGLQSIGTTQTELVKDPADPTGPLVYQDLTFTVDIAFADSLYFVVDDIGNGTGEYAECDETNNDLLLSLVSSVHGFKFEDIDGDGERDPEEPGMPGVLIYADLNGDGISNTTTAPHTLTMSDVLNTQVNEEIGRAHVCTPVTS